jgi:acyl-CoA thioester hydrolase
VQKSLEHIIEQDVRFSEVDSLGIVWHGHYVQYFEDGREAFGKQFGLAYLDFYSHGYVVPIVNINCDYKRFLKYGDQIRIETMYVACEPAKINFKYRVTNTATGELIVNGTTTQVFLAKDTLTLQLTNPDFFQEWKVKHGLI